ncbi:GA-like domain-containing protein, partial [Gallibacterium anatis]|uniref:GA-like domain-containing protein n=1 Tax=Gallibacterium anatis TaxID=750 RepID=UPI0030C9E350
QQTKTAKRTPDTVDAAEKAATDLVEKAEAAEQAAEKALEDANKDGLITPTEKAAIEAENAKVTEAKAKADEAVKALPAEST